MSNIKQSSLDWLAEQLTAKMQMWNSMKNYQEFHIVLEAGEFSKLIEQAKAMHKEEIRVAYMEGAFEKMRHLDGKEFMMPTDYYEETFGE